MNPRHPDDAPDLEDAPKRRGPAHRPPPGGKYLDVPQLAAEFGLSEPAVRDALLRGELRGRKVGRAWRVRREWIERWFEAAEAGPPRTGPLAAAVDGARRRAAARRNPGPPALDVGAGGGTDPRRPAGTGPEGAADGG